MANTPTLEQLQKDFQAKTMALHIQEAQLIVDGLHLGLDKDHLLLLWNDLATRMKRTVRAAK